MEDLKKGCSEMSDYTAKVAEALLIERMLDKAIKEGLNIEQFRERLDAYIEGLTEAHKP